MPSDQLEPRSAFQPSATCRWHGSLAGSATAFDQALVLPLHHHIQPAQQDEVVRTLEVCLQANRRAAGIVTGDTVEVALELVTEASSVVEPPVLAPAEASAGRLGQVEPQA